MLRFKSLSRFLLVWLGIIAILSISPVSAFAAEKPEIFVQLGHSDGVNSIAFSPDGKYLATGSSDKTLKLWEVSTGREIRTFRLEQIVVYHSVQFSPDGRYLASADGGGSIRLWDIATGKELKKFPLSISEKPEKSETVTGNAVAIAFSPDGKSLVVAANIFFHKGEQSYRSKAVINLWDVKTGKLNKIITVHAEQISDMALSPNGKYALLGCEEPDNTVRLLDIQKGKEVRKLIGHSKTVHSVAVSPDGEYVASGSEDKTIVMWHIKSGKKIKTFTNPKRHERFSIAFSPDGKRLIVSGLGGLSEMELWDVSTSQVIATLKGDINDFQPWAVIFSPDGRQIAVSASAVALWDISTVTYGGVYHTSETKAKQDGYSIGKLKTLGGGGYSGSAYFSSSGEKIIMVNRSILHEFDRFAGTLRGRKKIGNQYADERFFEVKDDDYLQGPISVIDGKKNGAIIRTDYQFGRDKEIPYFQTFSPDGRYGIVQELEGGDRFTYKIIDIRSKKEVSILENPSGGFMGAGGGNVIFSPDAKYLIGWYGYGSAGMQDPPVFKLWDVPTGKEIRTFSGHSHFISTAVFTADGGHILSGSMDKTLKLWDTKTGKEIKTFHGHANAITAIDISSDGRHVLSGDWNGDIKLWAMDSGREIKTFKGHTNWVQSVLFSPDEKYLVSGSRDGTTRLWDISTGKEIAQFIAFTDGEWIVITPEGYFNASSGGAKHINVRVGNNVYGIDQFYTKFYRPELVQLALTGKEVPKGELITDIAAQKPAPNVQILSPVANSSVDQDSLTVTLKITDSGGGIGSVNIFLNGAQVANNTRGIIVKGKAAANERILSFTIPLLKGQNEIRAVAFNGENTMESNPALISVISSAAMRKPNLYALVIGINTYRNQSISLTYAVPDAIAFAGTLQKIASPLFEKVDIRTLTTPEATTKEAITKAFEEARQMVRPNDLFIFYNASHGMVDVVNGEEQYFLLTSNVRLLSSQHISKDALSHKDLVNLIGSVPTQKKLVILDTCNAGKGGKEIQIALLQQTRGLTDATAVKLLQRAVGSSVFSASSDTQQALEGYKGHGLFTYVLLEGLQGKADFKKDGFVTVKGLALHTEERVMTLSEEVFKRQQNPMIETGAYDFPIGKVRE